MLVVFIIIVAMSAGIFYLNGLFEEDSTVQFPCIVFSLLCGLIASFVVGDSVLSRGDKDTPQALTREEFTEARDDHQYGEYTDEVKKVVTYEAYIKNKGGK